MDVISDIIKAFRRPADVPAHIRKLQQLLPLLAVQDSMLKQRIKSYTLSSISSQGVVEIRKLKKIQGKYARLKRKLTLLQRQYKGHPLKQAKRVLYYIKILEKVVHATDIRMTEMHRQIQGGHYNQSNDSVMEECADVSHVMHLQTSSSRQASQNSTAGYKTRLNLGPPTYTCQYCQAILWYEERTDKSKNTRQPKFTLCCMEGRIRVPLLTQSPPYLKYLLGNESGKVGMNFRKNIRVYNSMFAFTSMGGRVDRSINRSKGPYVFRISGQNYHHIGSLLPEIGKSPQFAQLYIYDTDNEIENRIKSLMHEEVETEIVQGISEMLDEHNVLVKSFRMARDRYLEQPQAEFRMRILSERTQDGRQYNRPTASEVAGLIVGDLTDANFQRDVIVEHRKNGLQRITDLHPCFMSMNYPLIHPYGEDGYRLGIPLDSASQKTYTRTNLTMRQFYGYRIQQRLNEGHTLLQAGRLFQQYIVDGYMAIEEERFRYIRKNQQKLRSDLYGGLMDAIVRGDSDCSMVGKTIILPSSHTGGPRYRAQNYQDAMAICRWAGYPDLFLTFTCNPKWPEINAMTRLINQDPDGCRVDIICRVFQIKLLQLMQILKKDKPFGTIIACIYTIEFQKRGLPHAHILFFLHETQKNPTTDHIDKVISAEIPDYREDPDGYNAVKNFMMHGPCGEQNPSCPCMKQGKCTKHFPKKYNGRTNFDSDGFPIYMRRDTSIEVKKNGASLDNRYVVTYNRDLLVQFDAHINVEVCNYARSVKYLFKYVHKGSDRATTIIESIGTPTENDEIKKYLDCRYISATEACWRIYSFDIHHRQPAVERLPFHLQGQNTIIFEESRTAESVLSRHDLEKTKFTEWFEANKEHPDARELTYSDFPTRWVWNGRDKKWTRRKKGHAVGRIYFAHPGSGERFYMRMLLNFVKGCTSFEGIRRINGVDHKTYREACYALGLLDDDKEWNDCLSEASQWASGNELRHLFVTILMNCQVSDTRKLWENNYGILSEDIMHIQRKRLQFNDLQLNTKQIEVYTLFEIESILLKIGRSLKDIEGMPLPDSALMRNVGNRLINEELDYDKDKLQILHDQSLALLNACQRPAYEAIITSVDNEEGKLFFIHGHGGTGKTFLWNTIISKIRSQSKIVLPVATSGITALLLPNGRTAHSRFHIPLDITPESTCEIKQGSQLAELLKKTALIIWDEAPMANKLCFEALDRTLRDILRDRYENSAMKPFGGITFVCGGDFRQILPVIPKGTRGDIVDAALNCSQLWPYFSIYELTENMRLSCGKVRGSEARKIASFDKWLLQIGDGSVYADNKKDLIHVPADVYIPTSHNQIESIVEAVYPSLLQNYNDPSYLKERAILTPKNEMVHELNEKILKLIPGEGRTYYSSDNVCKTSVNTNEEDILYPTEFLNNLRFPGIPNHDIHLKVGSPVMLLRNLNQTEGLCNGTRLIITHLGIWSVTANIISGKNIGSRVTIPRIIMSPNDSKWPFKLNRRQLPLAPCYAMTINKSQGQTLQRVGLYLAKQVFTHGQLYVAVSRVTKREGLTIVNADEDTNDPTYIKNIVYREIFQNVGPRIVQTEEVFLSN
ncbi:uncharacterized protein LOC125826778 [Solanum verrucosum]|nr:uncharacterized protein LOC125826778 [Solanum verrucosum]